MKKQKEKRKKEEKGIKGDKKEEKERIGRKKEENLGSFKIKKPFSRFLNKLFGIITFLI